MSGKDFGLSRRQLREGSRVFVEPEHYDEVLGSSEFFVYVTPNKNTRGFESLKSYLQSLNCEVVVAEGSPVQMPERYKSLKITFQGAIIPDAALRRIHKWAHSRNFLHSFFQPMI